MEEDMKAEEGIKASFEAAPAEWVADAEYAIVEASRRYPDMFTVNEVRPLMNPDLPQPKTQRALGGVLRKLAKEGYIEKISTICPTCHQEVLKESLGANGQGVTRWRAKRVS